MTFVILVLLVALVLPVGWALWEIGWYLRLWEKR